MAYRNVLVKSTPQGPIKKEWLMDATIQPGMLVEYASGTRIQMNTATLDPTLRVAVEDFETPIDGTYASGDLIPFVVPQSGDEIMLWATSTAAATISVTNPVFAVTGGFVHLGTAIAGTPGVAVALETVVLVANTPARILCEVL